MSQKIRIMIVDEDKPLGESLAVFFKNQGYLTKAIQDSARAVQELARHQYQVVILSLEMPAIGSMPLSAAIQNATPGSVMIASTTEPSVESAVASIKQGASDYLIKPLSLKLLLEAVNQALREQGLLLDPEERLKLAVGQRVRALRRTQGLTLKQLSNRASVSLSLMSQIELGKSAASIATLYKVVTALGVTLSTFFEKTTLQ